MNEEVQLKISNKSGVFYIEINGNEEAMMTFFLTDDNKMTIDHTEVNTGNEGKGFGKKLLFKAIEYARKNNLKIIPVCSFVKSVIEKTPEFKDIV
ncbi:GNAT family N-acetyltransferase [Flavobacterium psychraquaticum]|uniref:GNAT family N-acetyltransferase n=1 Tax=Flavobacterium psychraquaticum TaxID=3103958 RepID=UPI002ACDA188|nr:GNAT family N-acetyltransferase [Flavobacterium sp. LB-N7T]